MIIRLLDFETTGLPPKAQVIEVGICDVDTETRKVGEPFSMLCNPKAVIDPAAKAGHHITEADLADAPPLDIAFRKMQEGNFDVWAAHNAPFEREFFKGGDKPWICTLKAARQVFPEAPGHSNQVLRYYLGLPVIREIADLAHRAGPDAYVTAHLIVALLDAGATVEQMINWTGGPSLLPTVQFGKHRGKKWEQVPYEYLTWIEGQANMDPDVKHTAKHHINLRRGRAH